MFHCHVQTVPRRLQFSICKRGTFVYLILFVVLYTQYNTVSLKGAGLFARYFEVLCRITLATRKYYKRLFNVAFKISGITFK